MGNKPLVEIRPGAGLETGLYPTAEPTSGPIWRTGVNTWFRPLSVSHTLGTEKVIDVIGRSSQAMTQAFANGETRLYYEDLGIIFKWDGVNTPVIVDELSDSAVDYDLEPFGTWLLATDNTTAPKLWKNTGSWVDLGNSEFATGKIIKKLAQRVLIYATDVLPQGVQYSKPSDPEEFRPVVSDVITGAGQLPFRNIDSEIVAVAELAGGHAVYTEDKLLFLQYLGETLRFGTPNPPIGGIGAVSKDSVISRGSRNWGLFEGGVFLTDGLSFKLLDDPAMSEWLRDEVDWTRRKEVVGYYDKKLRLSIWSVPIINGGKIGITVDEQNRFGFMTANFSAALEQEVFDYPFIALSDGIHKASVKSTTMGTFSLSSQLLDGGTREHYKAWDFLIVDGTLSGQVRVGFTDSPDMDTIQWNAWETLAHRVPFTPRESVFMAIEFLSTSDLHLSGVKIYGSIAGLVT